ncbi:hypothetical protein H5410_011275 [Solanum commersonii]|uniref:Uncharacterized protein n=1 Tax=Solanum commersonii TaxID=4109 RepID=A0A9J6ANX7_SOLCO|nr:hypothetical protein H5410_011275 [Solanum commersonii]
MVVLPLKQMIHKTGKFTEFYKMVVLPLKQMIHKTVVIIPLTYPQFPKPKRYWKGWLVSITTKYKEGITSLQPWVAVQIKEKNRKISRRIFTAKTYQDWGGPTQSLA